MEQQPEQPMFTQPKDPNNETKPTSKNLATIVIEQITLFNHVS